MRDLPRLGPAAAMVLALASSTIAAGPAVAERTPPAAACAATEAALRDLLKADGKRILSLGAPHFAPSLNSVEFLRGGWDKGIVPSLSLIRKFRSSEPRSGLTCPSARQLAAAAGATIVTADEAKQLVAPRRKAPSSYVHTLRQAVVDDTGQSALVQLTLDAGMLDAVEYLLLFRREAGSWRMVSHKLMWIS